MGAVTLYAGDDQPKPLLRQGKQMIAIKNIVFDPALQPRENVDNAWSNDLSRFAKEGSAFPPIRVFQLNDGTLLAAEGWHRRDATVSIGAVDMLCEVVNGTREDAIVWAAGSNKSNGVRPMGPKDITKAVEMLFEIEKYRSASALSISVIVGCTSAKVSGIRNRMISEGQLKAPDFYVDKSGRNTKGIRPHGIPTVSPVFRGGRPLGFQAKWCGKQYYGHTEDEVREKIREAKEQGDKKKHKFNSMKNFCSRYGFVSIFGHHANGNGIYPGISKVWHRPGVICVFCDFSDRNTLLKAVGTIDTAIDIQNAEKLLTARGQIVAAEYKKELGCRKVIICYKEDGPFYLMELFKAAGFEFMTPDELIDSLKEQAE
jgi:hypothetical protein